MNKTEIADRLFADLVGFQDRIPLEVLREWIQDAPVSFEDVASFVRYHPDRYMRNSMFIGPAFQALVLCWRNGQRSPIHDHLGSSCALRIMQGEAAETVFDFAPNGMIFPVETRIHSPGHLAATQDRQVHQVSNLQAGRRDLVTLHVYSPPLVTMNQYTLSGKVTRFNEPINYEFMEGAGI